MEKTALGLYDQGEGTQVWQSSLNGCLKPQAELF